MTVAAKLVSWRAQPLSKAAADTKARQTMDLRAESALLGRSAILTGWTLFILGIAFFVGSIAGWMMIISRPTEPPKFYQVDRSTGIVAEPVSIKDAPTLFSEATDHEHLKRYILACLQWIPQMDRQNDRLCKLMSTPDQQARYVAWRAKPLSPPKVLGGNGFLQLDNFRYLSQPVDKKTNTRRYLVLFDYTAWHGSEPDPTEKWSATVDFTYHPELPMIPRDRDDNKTGFQAISLSASSDKSDSNPQVELVK